MILDDMKRSTGNTDCNYKAKRSVGILMYFDTMGYDLYIQILCCHNGNRICIGDSPCSNRMY